MAKGFGGRPGMGGGLNMNMIKQAQKMQQDMMKIQREIEEQTYTSASGGGAVSCTVSGKREVLSITIDPDAVDPEELDMLQDMIVAAVNGALRNAETAMSEAMQKCTSGLGNLGGLGLGL